MLHCAGPSHLVAALIFLDFLECRQYSLEYRCALGEYDEQIRCCCAHGMAETVQHDTLLFQSALQQRHATMRIDAEHALLASMHAGEASEKLWLHPSRTRRNQQSQHADRLCKAALPNRPRGRVGGGRPIHKSLKTCMVSFTTSMLHESAEEIENSKTVPSMKGSPNAPISVGASHIGRGFA